MRKMKKILAVLMATIIFAAMLCGISVNAKSDYWFDVTDTEVKSGQAVELNSINEGLRQKINDTVQNYEGCEVTFKVKYHGWSTPNIFADNVNKAVLVGIDYYKAYADIDGNYITFQWDELVPKHNMWGLISNIKFAAGQDLTITDIYVYVPPQDKPKLEDLSAGASCYEVNIPLE